MIETEKLLARLRLNPEQNCALINFVTDNTIHAVVEAGRSLFVRGVSDRNWVYFYVPHRLDFPALCNLLEPVDKTFALVEDWMLTQLSSGRTVDWQMSSIKLVLPLDKPLPRPRHASIPLRPEHAQYIYEHWDYAGVTTLDYTRERLARGISAGIFVGDKLAAWAATHDDGALGFMTVLPQYRNRGYALDLTLELVARQRELGIASFVHIEAENSKSLALAQKLGFISHGNVHWLSYLQQ